MSKTSEIAVECNDDRCMQLNAGVHAQRENKRSRMKKNAWTKKGAC